MWSWILTAFGITGLYFVGKKNKLGWVIGIGVQVLWLAYALSTEQYGFVVSCFFYGWINIKNFVEWRKSEYSDGSRNSF